jgi:citrate lyase subunit beta/citryl-CoA lyase
VARAIAADFLKARPPGRRTLQLFVRINAFDTGLVDADLKAVMPAGPDGIMLPKAASSADVTRLSARLRVAEAENGLPDGATSILALITETARGLLSIHSYQERMPRLAGVAWGAEDLSADLGARSSRDGQGRLTDAFRYARLATLLVAGATEAAAIDTVFTSFRDEAGLRTECEAAERDGFTAKMAIHPAQVPIINEVFTPSPEALAEARAVIEAFSASGDVGVVAINGRMYDRPHRRRAERLLQRAGLNQPE